MHGVNIYSLIYCWLTTLSLFAYSIFKHTHEHCGSFSCSIFPKVLLNSFRFTLQFILTRCQASIVRVCVCVKDARALNVS